MAKVPASRTYGRLYLPAISGPIGGGLIKLGHGSTWAAVSVGVAPYAVCVLLCAVFSIGYLAAVLRYLCAGSEGQRAMERLISVTASAVIAVLTCRAELVAGLAKEIVRGPGNG